VAGRAKKELAESEVAKGEGGAAAAAAAEGGNGEMVWVSSFVPLSLCPILDHKACSQANGHSET